MRILTVCLFLALLAGCKTNCCDPGNAPQVVVASIAKMHPEVARLTLHCRAAGADSAKVCASTNAARIGTASDSEDLQALKSGETVVLDEGSNVDVTVPIIMTAGEWTTVCGVTVTSSGAGRDQDIAKATAIALAVKEQLGGTCCDCEGGAK